jgi:hypothetical protein
MMSRIGIWDPRLQFSRLCAKHSAFHGLSTSKGGADQHRVWYSLTQSYSAQIAGAQNIRGRLVPRDSETANMEVRAGGWWWITTTRNRGKIPEDHSGSHPESTPIILSLFFLGLPHFSKGSRGVLEYAWQKSWHTDPFTSTWWGHKSGSLWGALLGMGCLWPSFGNFALRWFLPHKQTCPRRT